MYRGVTVVDTILLFVYVLCLYNSFDGGEKTTSNGSKPSLVLNTIYDRIKARRSTSRGVLLSLTPPPRSFDSLRLIVVANSQAKRLIHYNSKLINNFRVSS